MEETVLLRHSTSRCVLMLKCSIFAPLGKKEDAEVL